MYEFTTQAQIRAAFWESIRDHYPRASELVWKRQSRSNDFRTDVRVAFCDFIESLSRNNQISAALASRATLNGRN